MSGGQETRVTKISKLQDRVPTSTDNCLVAIHGPNIGKKYVLDEEEFTIGRDSKNNIVVDLDNVSRRHAKVSTRVGKCFVSDLGSTNGTYLNDEPLRGPAPLHVGDRIRIGDSEFSLAT